MWLMNNNGMVMSALGVGNVPLNWVVAGVGDFNGDGKSDILWVNTVSGELLVWLMNGAAAIGGGTPGTRRPRGKFKA